MGSNPHPVLRRTRNGKTDQTVTAKKKKRKAVLATDKEKDKSNM